MDLKIIPLTSENFSEIVLEIGSELPNIKTIKMLEEKAASETILKIPGVITPNGRLIGYGMYVT